MDGQQINIETSQQRINEAIGNFQLKSCLYTIFRYLDAWVAVGEHIADDCYNHFNNPLLYHDLLIVHLVGQEIELTHTMTEQYSRLLVQDVNLYHKVLCKRFVDVGKPSKWNVDIAFHHGFNVGLIEVWFVETILVK